MFSSTPADSSPASSDNGGRQRGGRPRRVVSCRVLSCRVVWAELAGAVQYEWGRSRLSTFQVTLRQDVTCPNLASSQLVLPALEAPSIHHRCWLALHVPLAAPPALSPRCHLNVYSPRPQRPPAHLARWPVWRWRRQLIKRCERMVQQARSQTAPKRKPLPRDWPFGHVLPASKYRAAAVHGVKVCSFPI
jgi:hypothetical protein